MGIALLFEQCIITSAYTEMWFGLSDSLINSASRGMLETIPEKQGVY